LFNSVNTEALLTQLVETLDDELEQLALLRFRFVVLASLVAADQSLWLPMSVHELERATEQLRLADLRRAAAATGVTEAFMLDADVRLRDIANEVDDSWGELLLDRRTELLEQVANLRSVAELTISALGRRAALVEEALAFLRTDPGSTYGRPAAPQAQIVRGAM
jgi:hypothetical protein